jgi:head-tail adaptor
MATKQRSAGDLFHSFAFDKRIKSKRGDGVEVGGWEQQFKCRAGVINLRGGESVMAGRLQGQHSQIVFVRASSVSREATTEWQARDLRTGVAYNIREITRSDDRLWLDFLCQSGVATG